MPTYSSSPSAVPTIAFRSTSTLPPSGSSLACEIHMVGAPGAQYVGFIGASTGPRRIPGTGGINPPGYGDDAGTGFYSPLGEPILCLFCLMLVYVCVKPIVKSLKSHSMKRLLSLFCLLCLTGPGLNPSPSMLDPPFLDSETTPRPVKRLVNGRLLIFTPSGTYDLLAHPQ